MPAACPNTGNDGRGDARCYRNAGVPSTIALTMTATASAVSADFEMKPRQSPMSLI